MAKVVTHPGEVLGDELKEIGISHERLGRDLDVSASTISRIVSGKQSITADMAMRLGHWFGTAPEFWMNLQAQYDLCIAAQKLGKRIKTRPTRPDAPRSVLAGE